MFSLLVTLIAIALVAMLALATLYYGGPIFNDGAEAAHAARIDAQSQQIMGAMELYNAEVGHYPIVLEDLVSANYLKSIPVAQAAQAVSVAMASTTTWLMAASGNPVIVTQQVPLSTCMAFNKLNLGQTAVLATVHSDALRQCYGTDPANLTILVAKSGADTLSVAGNPASVVQIGTVLPTPVPPLTDTSSNGWSILPSTPAPAPSPLVLKYTQADKVLTSLTFGATTVGANASVQRVTITNAGTTPLDYSGVTVPAPYYIDTANSDCTTSGTLAPNGTCGVYVGFSPLTTDTFSGSAYALSLNVTSGTVATLPLVGNGATSTPSTAVFQFINDWGAPMTQYDFGGVSDTYPGTIFTTADIYWVPVINVSTDYQTITNAGLSSPFYLVSNDCNYAVAPGETCYLEVAVALGQPDHYTGTLSATTPAQSTPLTLNLTADRYVSPLKVTTSTGALVTTSASAPFVMPDAYLNVYGYQGSTANLTITNTGSTPLYVQQPWWAVAGTPADAWYFNIRNLQGPIDGTGPCPAPYAFTMMPGQSCWLNLEFEPRNGASGDNAAAFQYYDTTRPDLWRTYLMYLHVAITDFPNATHD